jgi:hypothetical protein
MLNERLRAAIRCLAVATTGLTLLACASNFESSRELDRLAPFNGAINANVAAARGLFGRNEVLLTFAVNASSEDSRAVEHYSAELERHGWRPCMQSGLNRWEKYIDQTTGTSIEVSKYQGIWLKDSGIAELLIDQPVPDKTSGAEATTLQAVALRISSVNDREDRCRQAK